MRQRWRETDSDERLITASLRDPDAFGAFYLRHVRLVHRYLAARTADSETAADMTADVFIAAIAGRAKFDSRRGSAQTWLWQIVRSKLNDYLRHAQVVERCRRQLEGPVEAAIDTYDIGSDDGPAVEALARLPAEQRIAVRGHVIDGLSHAEIAERSQERPETVRKRVSRGLLSLRHALGEPQVETHEHPETFHD